MSKPGKLYRFLSDPRIHARANAPLAKLTSFQLGGPCDLALTCAGPDELETVVSELKASDTRHVVLGAGTNILASDRGFPGVVVRYVANVGEIRREGSRVEALGGMRLDDLAVYAMENGLAGLSFANGIPGTVGGAVAGNAGAFGGSVSDVLESVSLLAPDGARTAVAAADLQLGYRRSRLQQGGGVVLSARFHLPQVRGEDLRRTREDLLARRTEKLPDWRKVPCAGSFFRNVEPASPSETRRAAGWFLEQVGAKALRVGGAAVYEKHANVIIKASKDCTAQDVCDLARELARRVREQFGVSLAPEVRLLGEFERPFTSAGSD